MAVATRSAVTDYAERVVAGEIVTGQLVRQACERHLRDLGTWEFDETAAERAISFFHLLRHSKGEWAGEPLKLEPWQQFIVGSLFGWKRPDGTRRYRKAYIEVARKNGKSTLSAGVGILLAFFDNEPGAEVYAAATKRDQAKIVWGEARRMVKKSPALNARITTLVANMHIEDTASKFEPLGADSDSMDGLNIHGVIIDELHAHKTRAMYDVLETATGSRRQPLTFIITTAGFDRESICWQEHDYGVKILDGIIEDDAFFCFIATIDEEDDWRDPEVWPKANPNWGISVKEEKVSAAVEKAKQVPGEQNALLRLHLDVWTQLDNRWLDDATWEAGGEPFDPEILLGQECFAGLDLSTTTDLSACVLYFPNEDEPGGYVLPKFWIPEDNMRERSRRDRVPYEQWVREKYIKATPGNVIDYDVIRADINELANMYNIREIAADPWNSTQIQTQLMGDGFTVVPIRQGFASLTAPTKELGKLVVEQKLRHANNPVLRWCASNVAIEQDAAGNLKPSKKLSRERIDGIAALVNAMNRALLAVDGRSPYEDRGIFVV